MLLRAKEAFVDGDSSGALTNAWTASEGMLGDLLKHYLAKSEDRPAGEDAFGNRHKFIDKNRQDFLLGKEMTVRHTIEFLSLVGCLPFALYRDARACTKARNAWLHGETEPTFEDARTAIQAAGALFEMLEGVPLQVLWLAT
jgi:hypothetical protein